MEIPILISILLFITTVIMIKYQFGKLDDEQDKIKGSISNQKQFNSQCLQAFNLLSSHFSEGKKVETILDYYVLVLQAKKIVISKEANLAFLIKNCFKENFDKLTSLSYWYGCEITIDNDLKGFEIKVIE